MSRKLSNTVQKQVESFVIPAKSELDKAWEEVMKLYDRNLKRYGVSLPADGTVQQLWLSVLYLHRDEELHKRTIAKAVMEYRPKLSGDQQVRHLKRVGWRDVSHRRGWHRIDFSGPDPDWLVRQHRAGGDIPSESWEEVKIRYRHRCAWCNTKEGDPQPYNSVPVKLQQGHKDPHRPLTVDNMIPLCQYHNQAIQDKLVLNAQGFPKALGSTALVAASTKKVKLEILAMLQEDNELT